MGGRSLNINVKIVLYSIWLSLFTILIFPGRFDDTIGINYGYPFSFLTYYHQDIWFIRGVKIELMYFSFNVIIIYFIMLALIKVYNKIFKSSRKPHVDKLPLDND